MKEGPLAVRPATGRPLPIVLAGLLFGVIGLVWLGMAAQNIAWDEYKPGKPMDPDLLPWSVGLILFGAAFLGTGLGLWRLRAWGRKSAFLLGTLFLGMGLFSYWEGSHLLMFLFTPGLLVLLSLIYLARPSVGARFG
jgi:uncharacterized membrane protein (DUF2068 family)